MKKNKFIAILSFITFFFVACTQEVGSKDEATKEEVEKPVEPIEITDTPPSSPYTELESGINGSAGKNGRYVTFGSYPQSVLPENSKIKINESMSITVGAFTYYKGSDDGWYAKQWYAGDYRYFKVEPIKWRIVTDNYNNTGTKLLAAENILINFEYYQGGPASMRLGNAEYPQPNNYENSVVRAFLNGIEYTFEDLDNVKTQLVNKGFLQTAFTEEEQNIIEDTTVINNAKSTNPDGEERMWNKGVNKFASDKTTLDKIFLLSEEEVTRGEYGFEAYNVSDVNNTKPYGQGNKRIRLVTDYAVACGCTSKENAGSWWLRSPRENGREIKDGCIVRIINEYGSADVTTETSTPGIGVVPALCVK